jgi:hypothetical protein
MQTFVTGYQYGDRKQFIGQYVFETHGEFDVHMPPNTTLVEPPKSIPKGKEAIWMDTAWVLKDAPLPPVAPEVKTVRTDTSIPVIPVKVVPPLTEEELKAFSEAKMAELIREATKPIE